MKIIENTDCVGNPSELLRFLVVKTAPVMMKVRPSVLVRLCNCGKIGELQRYDQFCLHQREIMAKLETDFMIMKNTGRDIQVMFYDREVMQTALVQPDIRSCLDRRGYAGLNDVDSLLVELRRRFGHDQFPHEIGFFLGYPCKDVIGFIEKKESEAVPLANAAWRVFGNPSESLRRMWMYRFAEDIGRTAVSHCSNLDACIRELRKLHCT